MLKHFNQAKRYTQSYAVEIVNKIIASFDERFLSVHEEIDTGGVSITSEEVDKSYSMYVKLLTVLPGPHCKLKMMNRPSYLGW